MHAYTCTHTDVVRAYKSVLKEKEALEASIRAISSHTGGGGISEGGGGEEGEEGEGGEGEGRPPEDVESGSERRTDESGTEEGRMVEVKLSPEPKEVVKVTSSGYIFCSKCVVLVAQNYLILIVCVVDTPFH